MPINFVLLRLHTIDFFLYLKNYSFFVREYEDEDCPPAPQPWGNQVYSAGTDQPTRAAAYPFCAVSSDLPHHHVRNFGLILLMRSTPWLQTPMHVFLIHLACVENFYFTNVIPQMLVTFLSEKKIISYLGHLAQCLILVTLLFTDYYTLGAISYEVRGNLQSFASQQQNVQATVHLPGHFPYLWGSFLLLLIFIMVAVYKI